MRIEDRAEGEHSDHQIVTNNTSAPHIYPDAVTLKKDTLLHEVVHMFGIEDNERKNANEYFYDIMCYTYNSKEGPDPVIDYENIKRIQGCVNPS